jgi:DnaJ-class molecular chaperone
VLSDEKQREQYDRFGAAKPGQGGGGGGFSSFFDDDDEEGVDMDDFFASMFGGGGFGGPPPGFAGQQQRQQQQRRQQKKRGDDQVIELEVTLEECYTGKERKFELEKNVICSTCKGCARRTLFRSSISR